MSFGMKATAVPAADSSMPVLNAVTVTAVPTATDGTPTAWPENCTLALAPSDAYSRTQTVLAAVA